MFQYGFNGAAGVNPRIGRSCGTPDTRSNRFNGAAGVNPRIAEQKTASPFSKKGLLQWGRGCEPADSRGLRWSPSLSPGGFNGAAGVNPRIEALSALQTARANGFNGAAGVNPRIALKNL